MDSSDRVKAGCTETGPLGAPEAVSGCIPRITAFGGGTGLSNLLRGLKAYTDRVTAVVTVCDNGGSSGRLRREFDVPPPGDIRSSLAALADTEPLMAELLQYRFEESDLEGHSLGNLLLTALTRITGDFGSAVREANKILKVRGRVLPATLDRAALVADHGDGTKSTGEVAVGSSGKPIHRVELKPGPCRATTEVIKAIAEADLLVFGPGSLYTSVIPTLLVGGIVEAARAAGAPRVYVCNVMTQPGETAGYSVGRHVDAVEGYTGEGFFDYVVVNTGEVPQELAERYMRNGQYPVQVDRENLTGRHFRLVEGDIISRHSFARHDAAKEAGLLMGVLSSVLSESGPLSKGQGSGR
jgi:uncharacterized cofD-like protein